MQLATNSFKAPRHVQNQRKSILDLQGLEQQGKAFFGGYHRELSP